MLARPLAPRLTAAALLACATLLGAHAPLALAEPPPPATAHSTAAAHPDAAAPAPRLDGHWSGALAVSPTAKLRVVFHVARAAGGGWTATMDSPDQGALGLAVDHATLAPDGRAVTFALAHPAAAFAGTLDAAGDRIVGAWKQGGATLPLTLTRSDAPPESAPVELWEGTLKVPPGMELRLVLRVARPKGAPPRATLDSPDQGALGIPVEGLALDGHTLAFSVKAVGGSYSGALDPTGRRAAGEWTQRVRLPLTLARVDKLTETRRPQTPRPPFPYRSVDVTYRNERGGVTLAGTLTEPAEGTGPFPAVLLITGSGAQDRDETLFQHKPFAVLADALTRRGVAVLRVDDRGVGGSTGSTATSTTEDFAGDVEAGVALLTHRKEIDPKRVGLLGHSEGGLIAPMVAARVPEVAFIVLIAGPGLPGDEILIRQGELILRAGGADAATLERQRATQRRIFDIVKHEKPADAEAKVRAALHEIAAALPATPPPARPDGGSPAQAPAADEDEAMVKVVLSPWFRFFLGYDPRPTLARVRCPVLAVNGGKDLQVPPRDDLAAIARALDAGGNKRHVERELPGLNHLLQTATTGAPSEYGRIEETIAPEALAVIGDWIVETVRPGGARPAPTSRGR